MCGSLSYSYASDWTEDRSKKIDMAAAAAERNLSHEHVDCGGIQHFFLEDDKSGKALVHSYLPLSEESKQAVLFFYPVDAESCKFMVDGGEAPCCEKELRGIVEVEKLCPAPQRVHTARYRSLDGGDDDAAQYRSLGGGPAERIVLPEARCLKKQDGSCSFVLHTAGVKTEEELAESIANGKYSGRVQYLKMYGEAVMDNFLEALDANGINAGLLMEMDKHDATKVSPLATMAFLDKLYPNLAKGQNLIIGIPRFVDDKPYTNGAFTATFVFPEIRKHLPFLGVQHPDDPDLQTTETPVEKNLFVVANKPFSMTLPNPDTGVDADVTPHHPKEFWPQPKGDQIDPSTLMHVDGYRSLWSSYEPDDYVDYAAWHTACNTFQKSVTASILANLAPLMKRVGFELTTDTELYVTNLVGTRIYSKTCSVQVRRPQAASAASSVLSRMRAEDKKRKGGATDETGQDGQDGQDGGSSRANKYVKQTEDNVVKLLSQSSEKVRKMATTLCNGMNSEYVDLTRVGIDRFRVNKMEPRDLQHLDDFLSNMFLGM